MTTAQFIEHYLAIGGIDFDGAWGKQCVDLFRAFHKDVLGRPVQPRAVIGAKNFWANYDTDPELIENYEKLFNTLEFVPQEGDIPIWDVGLFGHIAVANGVGNTNTFESCDQNWFNKREIKMITHNYSNVLGVLRPRKESMPSELEACMADRLKFWEERDLAREQLEIANKEISKLEKKIADHECPVILPPEPSEQIETGGKVRFNENGEIIWSEKTYKPAE